MKKDAKTRLLDMTCSAIDAVGGNAARAKFGLSKDICEARDLDVERELYKSWHDAALDGPIRMGYNHYRAHRKYSSARGTKSVEPPVNGGASPQGSHAFGGAAHYGSTGSTSFHDGQASALHAESGRASPDQAATQAAEGIEGFAKSTFPDRPAQAPAGDLDLGLHGEAHGQSPTERLRAAHAPRHGIHVEPEAAPKKPYVPHVDMDTLRAETRVMRSCALDIFLINGKPIRQCTARECRELAALRPRRRG